MGWIEYVKHDLCEPREPFIPFHHRSERFAVIVAHRRAGKTVAAISDTIKRAVDCPLPHPRYAFVAPFLAQAKEVAWDYLARLARRFILGGTMDGAAKQRRGRVAREQANAIENPGRPLPRAFRRLLSPEEVSPALPDYLVSHTLMVRIADVASASVL